MAAGTFLTEHRNGASDHAGEPQQDMNADNGQKHRVRGWYNDPRDICDSITHVTSRSPRREIARHSHYIISRRTVRLSVSRVSLTGSKISISLDIWNQKAPFSRSQR